ncbi:hypothetical protein D9613_006592 [Agrocybe pediades]|uniref:Uncharacterized protein n=1 Tax=Agrocybe pediades TaxID=84607 RepID=A0A8H4QI92_9AGAR|nr:hypothetical protein D9613_006592 [Agrocybe pediades]
MASRHSSTRKPSTDVESISKASNGSRKTETAMSIPRAEDDQTVPNASQLVGQTANVMTGPYGGEWNKEKGKASSDPLIPVEVDTAANKATTATTHRGDHSCLKPSSGLSSQSFQQALPPLRRHPQPHRDQETYHPKPYVPIAYDLRDASTSALPYDHTHHPANHNEKVDATASKPPWNYSDVIITTQRKGQPSSLPDMRCPSPAPTPAGHILRYHSFDSEQTSAPRSYINTRRHYPVDSTQQAPRAAPVPDKWHEGNGSTSERQGTIPFRPVAQHVLPQVALHYTHHGQQPSRKHDAFVANDPWRRHIYKKHHKDTESFDEIPLHSWTHSSRLDGSVHSDGQLGASSPVADPVSHPGHHDENEPRQTSASPSNLSRSTEYYITCPSYDSTISIPSTTWDEITFQFIVATLPGQVYLNILLRLPSLYFSRVARIFEEADLTLPELKKMALETASQAKGHVDLLAFESNKIPQYDRLRSTWEYFIDSLMREWKTFNIISVLLLSAILTILQIKSAAEDPVIRYAALTSMICALVSLLFGCMYIIRFGSMRKTYKAAEWALEAQSTKTSILWNVWVMLAMPAIWLTWSIILYIACIMSFIWRTSPLEDANPPNLLSSTMLLITRTVISSILGVGLIYGALVLRTFRRYGEVMDRQWKRRIDGWIEEKNRSAFGPLWYPGTASPHTPPVSLILSNDRPRSRSPILEDRSSSRYRSHPDVWTKYSSARTTPNRSPAQTTPKTPESALSTLGLDWGHIDAANKPRRSTDSYSVHSTEGSSSSGIPGSPTVSSSSRPQGRRGALAMPPATYLPPIPGTPNSPMVLLGSVSQTPHQYVDRSTNSTGVEERQGFEQEQNNEDINLTVTDKSPNHVRTRHSPPMSDDGSSLSELEIPTGGPSITLAGPGTSQRTVADSPSQSSGHLDSTFEYEHEHDNEGLHHTRTDSPPKQVGIRPPSPMSDHENSLSRLGDSPTTGPSIAMADTTTSQRIKEGSPSNRCTS